MNEQQKNRLNILITGVRRSCGIVSRGARIIADQESWISVHVRYGYSEFRQDERLCAIAVPMLQDRYDPNAINHVRGRGAFVEVPDLAAIRSAVGRLRAEWGNLHVQDNSGLCAALHQGKFVG